MDTFIEIIRMILAIIGFYIVVYISAFLASRGWHQGRGPVTYNVNLGDGWGKKK